MKDKMGRDGSDAFVKMSQERLAKFAGKEPKLTPEMMKLNACMTNTGQHASELARKLTSGLDKTAFPVK